MQGLPLHDGLVVDGKVSEANGDGVELVVGICFFIDGDQSFDHLNYLPFFAFAITSNCHLYSDRFVFKNV